MKRIITLVTLFIVSIVAFAQRSEGTASANLDGRSLIGSIPKLTTSGQVDGTVVVTIKVDQYGNVTEAIPGAEGTTTTNKSVLNAIRNAAMKAHFNTKADAPVVQTGTITYSFKPENSASQSLEITSEVIDESAIRFLGVPIDGSRQYMLNRLKAIGFVDSNRDFLEGQFNGEPVKVFVHTYHDKVDRIIVVFDTVPEMNLREQYNNLLALFQTSKKYKPIQVSRAIPKDDFFYWTNTEYKSRFSVVSDSRQEINGEVWFAIIDKGGYRVGLYYDNLNNRPHGEDL